ncbi:outer membrane protein assembly factor BamE domain-containing protein [Pseudomonas sp. CNPSo 3701]|uniref:outer membrane protein assembly factor BamE domain-containing protein n=1 Tax=Pseudomonas sp. CNPSo 3701 TaxID=3027943 RepID=UPI0023643296|nr:outer membrane protein assembly factor BamE [Pseudomonas sp. CNPSo 3701]MDD1509904.1 outer membrane protein assembly factor BamE [Pseudomonas sp. CNPSo 3701]
MHWTHCATVCAILLYPIPTLASSVFRCEDANGHITFTKHGCTENQQQQEQRAHNPRPGSGAAVPLASPRASNTTASSRSNESTLTIVGDQQDGCDNAVIGNARREAIIRKQVRAGMTRSDVESALGKPERVTKRNGQTTYHYASKHNSERRTVTFDQNDCVAGKR